MPRSKSKDRVVGKGRVLKEVLVSISNKLSQSSSTSRLDAELITAYALNKTREWLFLNPGYKISPPALQKMNILIRKRQKGWPVAYLIKNKEFFSLNFYIDPTVLIPRPETELMIEYALKKIKLIKNKRLLPALVMDIGTGSGCIIITIAKNLKENFNVKFVAADISADALKVARKNIKKHSLKDKIKLFRSNLLEFTKKIDFDNYKSIILTANLPYLSKEQYKTGSLEIKKEPRAALIAKDKGTFLIKQTVLNLSQIKESISNLKIYAFFEIDPSQKTNLNKFLLKNDTSFKKTFLTDLNSKTRILCLRN